MGGAGGNGGRGDTGRWAGQMGQERELEPEQQMGQERELEPEQQMEQQGMRAGFRQRWRVNHNQPNPSRQKM